MKSIERLWLSNTWSEQKWKRYSIDTLLGTVGSLLITLVLFTFHLYPTIPNISLVYLLIVLGLASTRGLYAAIMASVAAFLAFDFFMIEPHFTLTIHRFEEWLALFVFLITAIITGQLASALRNRAELARQREGETRALYNVLHATTREVDLNRQLHIIAQSVVDNFASAGVRDCAILLPDERGKLQVRASARQPVDQILLSLDEETTAAQVMEQGKLIDLYISDFAAFPSLDKYHRLRRIIKNGPLEHDYICMVPLRPGQISVGVVRLLLKSKARQFLIDRSTNGERVHNPQTAFFWTFLDQATALIERARLRREALEVELLRRTDALRSALLSSVSHDLRTPLTSIKAAASSLLQEDVEWDDATERSFAQAIERQADRLNRLVGNLLDMSRIEGGALKPEKEWYPVAELIHDVLDHMQRPLHGREVCLSLPDNLPPLELDYLQMDQVLTNLLENAIRYTPPESPIEIMVEEKEKEIMISIADRGPGIPPGDTERIFDKFYRVSGTQPRSSTMGTGLGLAVCRGLVEAHGGRIWAENQHGGGAIFRFTLPLGKMEGYTHE